MIPLIPLLRAGFLLLGVSWWGAGAAAAEPGRVNLLVNAAFNFHAFENSRKGEPTAGSSGAVPGWDQEAHRDCEVFRAPCVAAGDRSTSQVPFTGDGPGIYELVGQ